jgi:hypothetical protein
MATNQSNDQPRSGRALPEAEAQLIAAAYWKGLSSSAQRMLIAKLRGRPPKGRTEKIAPPALQHRFTAQPSGPGIPANVRVNNPSEDTGASTTQSEPSLAVSGPNVVVGFNDSAPVASFSGYSNSSDGGQTFTDDGGVQGQQSGDAVVAANRAGVFYYAMLSTDAVGQSMIGVSSSTDNGQTFTLPVDASTSADGPGLFQDKEWLTTDNTGGPNDGNLYLAWTQFTQTQAQILFARSVDGGSNWSAPISLSGLGPGLGHQAAMPAVGPNGVVYVTWLDRATGQIPIRLSNDGGQTFTNPITGQGVVQAINQIPDTLSGNIRADSFPSIAVDQNSGAIYIAYAATVGNDQASVFLVSSTDGGQSWSNPLLVNDDGTVTDQWMPSLAVTSTGVVGIMFYDRRNDQANNLNIDIYLALSRVGGATILPNQRITTVSFPPAVNFDPAIATNYMGDYNQMVAVGNRFYLAWGDNRDLVGARNDPNVYFAVFDA